MHTFYINKLLIIYLSIGSSLVNQCHDPWSAIFFREVQNPELWLSVPIGIIWYISLNACNWRYADKECILNLILIFKRSNPIIFYSTHILTTCKLQLDVVLQNCLHAWAACWLQWKTHRMKIVYQFIILTFECDVCWVFTESRAVSRVKVVRKRIIQP